MILLMGKRQNLKLINVRYEDDFVRSGEGWKISSRTYISTVCMISNI